MGFYTKKPVTIEAVQYKEALEKPTLTAIGNGPVQTFLRGHGHTGYGLKHKDGVYIPFIRTLEGDMLINEGDWVIRGVKGEFYPCKPDIFEATYDKK